MQLNHNITRRETALTNAELMHRAPSIFASQPWNKMSSRYTFIPTITVVDKMRQEGFEPYAVAQSRTRIEGKQDFTRHMIRFRDVRNGDQPVMRALGTIYPELILTNSHDGASAYKIDAGLFRLVCLNGLVVGAGEISTINVRHSGSADGIIDATYEMVEQFPKMLNSVEEFSQKRLSAPQRSAFANAALELRYDAAESPIAAESLLRTHRSDDTDPNLFVTMNVVQENLLNGGIRGRNPQTKRNVRTRAVNGISENTRLNKALWTLTEQMAKLVA